MNYFYTTHASPVGIITLVSQDDVLTEINFGEHIKDYALKSDKKLKNCKLQLDDFFSGNRKKFDLKYKLEGTDFQERTLKKVAQIPYGTTCSYADLAKLIGSPKSARAVGRANATNKLPFIIPCHRVIGANGSLTGYAGGIENKKILLDLENIFKV